MNLLRKLSIIILLISVLFGCRENISEQGISFENDGMIQIDGKRTFIIGSYHHPKTENPFQALTSNGYNYVHVAASKAQLDSALEYNLMTWMTTGIVNNKDESDTTRIAELVNNFKDHPSLLFWEIADEPAFNWNNPKPRITSEKMEEAYKLIKSLDTKHQVFTNHGPVNLISTLQKYNSSTDIVAVDVYPVIPHGIKPSYALYPDGLQGDLLNTYISQVGQYTDKMKKVVNSSKPVFMVLQGFAWEMLKPNGERDLSMIQYPTYEESRFMAYNSIIHGANGILYWGTNYTPQPSQFINDLNRVTKELAEMQEVISTKTIDLDIIVEYHELMYSVDTGVEIMVKKVAGKTYILTVNSDKNPVKITFKGLSGFNEISVLSENRDLKITDGEFTDSYNRFGVHIYELK